MRNSFEYLLILNKSTADIAIWDYSWNQCEITLQPSDMKPKRTFEDYSFNIFFQKKFGLQIFTYNFDQIKCINVHEEPLYPAKSKPTDSG